MFPVDGLSISPIVGNLEVTLRTDDLNESFYGAATVGSTTTPTTVIGLRNTLWSVGYSNSRVRITKEGTTLEVFEQAGITELSAGFDRYMLPVIAYKIGDNSYVRYFDVINKIYVVKDLNNNLTGLIKTPRLCFDDRRSYFRSTASVVLGFYIEGRLYVKTSDDGFQFNQLLKTETSDGYYLEQICMGDNNRLHFVTYTLIET